VLDIADLEEPDGAVISVGGQLPNNLAMGLHQNGLQILGTSVEAIDACENRFKFSQLCDSLRVDQPEWSQFTTVDEAYHFAKCVGYPCLVRPSYVLSGAAMRVVASDSELERFLRTAAVVSRDYPVVITTYISGAKEVELDAVGHEGELLNYAIAEHVENAGVHSGDASLLLPAQKLFVETHRRVKQIGQKLCRALKISGPFNMQFICKDNEVKVIECNLRASRSMPFISKTYNVNLIDLATRVMVGSPVNKASIQPIDMEYIATKVPVFSFGRLKNSDPRLGVEMQSTGEVACFGVNQYEAFLKAMIAGGFKLPTKNVLISIGPSQQKTELVQYAQMFVEMGFQLFATKDTAVDRASEWESESCSIRRPASENTFGIRQAAEELPPVWSTKRRPVLERCRTASTESARSPPCRNESHELAAPVHTAAADSSCSADCEEAADGSVESATAVVVDTSLRKEEGISESSWSIGDIDHWVFRPRFRW